MQKLFKGWMLYLIPSQHGQNTVAEIRQKYVMNIHKEYTA